MAVLSIGTVFSMFIAVVVSQAKIRRGAGVLAVGRYLLSQGMFQITTNILNLMAYQRSYLLVSHYMNFIRRSLRRPLLYLDVQGYIYYLIKIVYIMIVKNNGLRFCVQADFCI